MRALQLVEYGRFELVDLPTPAIAPDEVLIRVRACGICGSDVHGMDGSTGRRVPPIVMGHEAAGEIVDVGVSVTHWSVGDRVTMDSTLFCGQCHYCRGGHVNLCDRRQVLGVSCEEYSRQGAFAEYVAVPARVLARLPASLSFDRAALVEPVAVAVHGVKRAGLKEGQSIVVVGVGMIGVLVVQVAKALGAGRIVAVDIDPAKLEFARSLGATESCDSSVGMEVDCAVEAVGVSHSVDMAIRSVRKGGTVTLVGNLTPHVEVPLQAIVTRELSVLGSCASQGDYPQSLDLIDSGAVQVDPIISARIPLESAPEYFERLHRREPGLSKVLVCP